ncbi:MAG TPA: hypothetical protein VMH01_10005 [Puia sp.]|nr:hypothetical protein [Puia sp.]
MKVLLILLNTLVAITAIISGGMMMAQPAGSSLHLPATMLETTPFHNYFIPGLLLACITGGINLLAVVYNLMRHKNRYNWSMAGALVLIGWIIAQLLLTGQWNWVQVFFLGIGILIVLQVWQLKGKWAS